MKFNLNEEKLRKIIRSQLKLTEDFNVDTISTSDISDCNLQAEPGATIPKNALKTANLVSKLYGVPGSLCAMIAAVTPGVYQDKQSSSRPNRDNNQSQETEAQSVYLLSSVSEKIKDKRTLYTRPVITESPANSSNESAWQTAQANYQGLVASADAFFIGEDPKDLADGIVSDFFMGEGSARKIKKQIDLLKSSGMNDVDIVRTLKTETLELMNAHAKVELYYHRAKAQESNASAEIIAAIDRFAGILT